MDYPPIWLVGSVSFLCFLGAFVQFVVGGSILCIVLLTVMGIINLGIFMFLLVDLDEQLKKETKKLKRKGKP